MESEALQDGANDASPSQQPYPLPELFTADEWKALGLAFRLSPRQLEVARLICLGVRKQKIAESLKVSEAVIRLHVKELFQKLDVHDRVGVPVRLVVTSHGGSMLTGDRDEPT